MGDAQEVTEGIAAVAMDPAAEAEKAAKAAAREADKARKKAEKAAKEAAKLAAAEARAAAGPVQIKLVPKPPVELESCPGTRDFYPEDMRVCTLWILARSPSIRHRRPHTEAWQCCVAYGCTHAARAVTPRSQ
jgi:hypothetical protein